MILDIDYCEICGKSKDTEVLSDHHIKHRAAGGKDISENILKVCGGCHGDCHTGKIKLWEQIEKVAQRTEKTPEEICEIIGLMAEKVLPHDYVFEGQQNPLKGLSLEDVLQTYFSYEEIGEQAIWGKAKILAGMVDAGWKPKVISSLVGCSPATIRERVRTYKAFPDETTRALDKSFTHHRIAAKTDNPIKWIEEVCVLDLSTRQLGEAIKAEGQSEVLQKDAAREKAERVIRMVNEILAEQDDVAEWLFVEMKNIMDRSDDLGEKNENICEPCDSSPDYCESNYSSFRQ